MFLIDNRIYLYYTTIIIRGSVGSEIQKEDIPMLRKVTDTIFYVGANDHDVDLFEGQYVVPNGMAYNSLM